MSRTTIEVPMKTNCVDEVLSVMGNILEPAGYRRTNVNGQAAWTKGDGILTMEQYIGAAFTENSVLLQGWIKKMIMGECTLDEAGIVMKKKPKGLMDTIRSSILSRGL